MSEQQTNYRQILKATSLFGGVQVLNIITGIIRSKFVAIFLGPAGMGISSLLVSSVTLVSTISSMGLNYSAIRNISNANETNDDSRLSFIMTIFRRWIILSCIIGSFLLICLSPFLSQFTFGNYKYTLSFVFLSLLLVFNTLYNGNTAFLQGTRQLKYTAKSSIYGSVFSLLTSVPLYYYFGIKGIVPSLIIGGMTSYFISNYYFKKINIRPIDVSRKDTFEVGKEMAQLGIVMVAAQLLGSIIVYIINTFIRHKGGIIDVGLYQAGTSLTFQSIGLVFTAMAVDYFPRLSAVHDDNKKVNEMVNQQSIITVLLASPILIFLIVFSPFIIHILLSPSFYVITNFIRWLAFGTLFTAPTVVIGYIPLAKGDKKNYFLYGSLFNNILSLFFYTVGYMIYGLTGMAIAYSIFQISYGIFLYSRFHIIYNFSFNKHFLYIFGTLILFCVSTLIISILLANIWEYIIGSIILALSIHFSLAKIDRYINLKQYLYNKFSS